MANSAQKPGVASGMGPPASVVVGTTLVGAGSVVVGTGATVVEVGATVVVDADDLVDEVYALDSVVLADWTTGIVELVGEGIEEHFLD